jgi:radical SAM/Cys-rich protein
MSANNLFSESSDENRNAAVDIVPFKTILEQHNIALVRANTDTLQINLGFLCNQICRHCHLSAGPGRRENMDTETVDAVVEYAARCGFETIDITGGAPELNPNLSYLIEKISPYASRVMLRTNLSVMKDKIHALGDLLQSHRVILIASFPSLNVSQTDSQRGQGIFNDSIAVLKKLNDIGYGINNSAGLELHLVSNPTGAYLPPTQKQAQERFRQVLENKWAVVFNNLYSFANVPLGRFRQWLLESGNLENYMTKLISNFNVSAVEGLMCRTLVSVSWDGYLYDCDFNLARGLFMGGRKIHVSELKGPPKPGSLIATADHCYTCTAGSGFT